MTPITVFYSWQSDLPRDVNNLHKKAIQDAISKYNEEATDKMKYDEAGRDETGSINILESIFKKISSCDIFIADISTINQLSSDVRKVPSPNVCVELGYAASVVGWNRIILIFNDAFGDFKLDLPFDLPKNRMFHFKIKDKTDKSGTGQLRAIIMDGITRIAKANFPYGDRYAKSEYQLKRARDVKKIEALFSNFNIEIFDNYVENMPAVLFDSIFPFWESFRALFMSNKFHLYDQQTFRKIDEFVTLWAKSLNHGDIYYKVPHSRFYRLNTHGDIFERPEDEKEMYVCLKEILKLKKKCRALIIYLRERYYDIDFDELSDKAFENNKKYIQEEPDE